MGTCFEEGHLVCSVYNGTRWTGLVISCAEGDKCWFAAYLQELTQAIFICLHSWPLARSRLSLWRDHALVQRRQCFVPEIFKYNQMSSYWACKLKGRRWEGTSPLNFNGTFKLYICRPPLHKFKIVSSCLNTLFITCFRTTGPYLGSHLPPQFTAFFGSC